MSFRNFLVLPFFTLVLLSCKKDVQPVYNTTIPFYEAPCEIETNLHIDWGNGTKNYITSDSIFKGNATWTQNCNYLIKLYDSVQINGNSDVSLPVFEIAFKSEPTTGLYSVVTELDATETPQIAIYREFIGMLYRSLPQDVHSVYIDNRSGIIRISVCEIYYDLDGSYTSFEAKYKHKFKITK